MANEDLQSAKMNPKDEFYTTYELIQDEINAYLEYNPNIFKGKTILLPCDDPEWSNFTRFFAQNFENFGLKKLISTSYAYESKNFSQPYQISLFEMTSPKFDEIKSKSKGKIFTLTKEINKLGYIDFADLDWDYLEGDGDFRSEEVKKLRDEADIIITNPPFSLYREFVAWIFENGEKEFLIMGSLNSLTYREIFPLVKNNKMWIGPSISGGDREFRIPDEYPLKASNYRVDEEGNKYIRVKGVRWFTNLDHGRRHEPLSLMNMKDNLKFNNKLIKRLKADYDSENYPKYENFNAIETPFTDAIPSDYNGIIGVPISFLDKYNPEQFEIIGLGISNSGIEAGVKPYKTEHKKYRKEIQKRGAVDGDLYLIINNTVVVPYARILIKHRR